MRREKKRTFSPQIFQKEKNRYVAYHLEKGKGFGQLFPLEKKFSRTND